MAEDNKAWRIRTNVRALSRGRRHHCTHWVRNGIQGPRVLLDNFVGSL
jgi:hypothetical protein